MNMMTACKASILNWTTRQEQVHWWHKLHWWFPGWWPGGKEEEDHRVVEVSHSSYHVSWSVHLTHWPHSHCQCWHQCSSGDQRVSSWSRSSPPHHHWTGQCQLQHHQSHDSDSSWTRSHGTDWNRKKTWVLCRQVPPLVTTWILKKYCLWKRRRARVSWRSRVLTRILLRPQDCSWRVCEVWSFQYSHWRSWLCDQTLHAVVFCSRIASTANSSLPSHFT